MNLHTGFALNGYDLSEAPDYFPPVFMTSRGLQFKQPIFNADFLQRHPEAVNDPETLTLVPGVPIKQDPAWLTEIREPANREAYAGMAA